MPASRRHRAAHDERREPCARRGVDLHRATLASWVCQVSFHLRPVVDYLTAALKTSEKLGLDVFGLWLDEQRERVSPRSRLVEKLTYIANQWDGLLVFLKLEGETCGASPSQAQPPACPMSTDHHASIASAFHYCNGRQ